MPTFFTDLPPIMQALLATLFRWGVTALGASTVLFTREFNQKVLEPLLERIVLKGILRVSVIIL